MSQTFIYAVVNVPIDSVATNFYGQCHTRYEGENEVYNTWNPPNYKGCKQGEVMYNPRTSSGLDNKPEWDCVPAGLNNPDHTTCSAYPPQGSSAPSEGSGGVSVYTYLNGVPSFPPQSGPNIPAIGGHYPMDLVIEDPVNNPPITGGFVGTTVEGSSGVAGSSAKNPAVVKCSALILVYDLAWVQTWSDLDYFAPLSLGGAKSNVFLNQTQAGSGNACSSDRYFYLATGTPYQNGTKVPNLEDQWPTILAKFCSLTSSSTSGNPSPCRAGVNVGSNSCSNIMGLRNDGGTNYCWTNYRAFLNPPNGTNPLAVNAINTAMVSYCQSFPITNGTPQAPPECYCVTPTAQTSYQNLVEQMTNLAYSLPTDPASDASNPFGPMGCWYIPCTYAQSTTTLVPQNIITPPASCPTVCENIVNIFTTGEQGGKINLAGADITQLITCCASGQCTTSPVNTCNPACAANEVCLSGKCIVGQPCGLTHEDCPSGQQRQNGACVALCSSDSECSNNSQCVGGICQPRKSLWSRYWILIVIGIIFLLFLIFIFYLIFKG
jgi:hypothetical protein